MLSSETGSTPMSRRERKALETRAAILDAAFKLIQRDGYDAATIERIAEEADVAPRTFFRYFPNKEAILFAEFDAARQAMVQALYDRPEDEDLLESIAIVLRRFSLEIDRRWDEFAWVREVTGTYTLMRSPERIIASQEISIRIAEFIADRLGVDMESDVRPATWSKAITAAFGQAGMLGPSASPSGQTYDLFIDMLDSTARTLDDLRNVAQRVSKDDLTPLSHGSSADIKGTSAN